MGLGVITEGGTMPVHASGVQQGHISRSRFKVCDSVLTRYCIL